MFVCIWLFSSRYTIWHILSKITKDNGVLFSVPGSPPNITSPGDLALKQNFIHHPKSQIFQTDDILELVWCSTYIICINEQRLESLKPILWHKFQKCLWGVNWSSSAPGPVPSCSVVEQLTSCDRIQAVVHTLRLWWLSSPSIIILWWERWEWFHPPGEATDKTGLCERCRQELQNNRKPSRWKSQPQKVLCFCRNFYSLSSQYPCSF